MHNNNRLIGSAHLPTKQIIHQQTDIQIISSDKLILIECVVD